MIEISLWWDEALVICVLGLAILCNIAVLLDVQIRESPVMTAGRRLIIAAQALFVMRLSWRLYDSGDSNLSWMAFFAFLTWGLGSIVCSLDHITRRWQRRELSDYISGPAPLDSRPQQ